MPWGRVVATAALMALAMVVFGCSSGAGTTANAGTTDEPAAHDTVVAVELTCTYPEQSTNDGNGNPVVTPARQLSSAECEDILATYSDRRRAAEWLNASESVTIRTPSGDSYTVEMPAATRVSVGEPWPPGTG